ncbi:MAG: hypothetical protein RLO18_20615 [Gimesia chilikensis]
MTLIKDTTYTVPSMLFPDFMLLAITALLSLIGGIAVNPAAQPSRGLRMAFATR